MINPAQCRSGDKHAGPNATSSIAKSPAVIASWNFRFNNETRRHTFLRKSEPVRVKVKKEAGDYANWYRVAQGWQAAKPAGYIDCPYFVSVDPFDSELASQILFWPEGEKDCDSLAARGELAFCFGGCGDGLPNFDTQILVDRHLVILADNDELGRLHAERKAMLAHPIAASVASAFVTLRTSLPSRHATARRALRWVKANKAAGEEISIADIRALLLPRL